MDHDPSDPQLVARMAQGDTGALGQLVHRHQRKVLALSYRLLGRVDQAQDAAQDVFIKVYRAAPGYQPQAQFTTWLYRIVVNHCLDMKRKAARRPVNLDPAWEQHTGDCDDDPLIRRERAQRVQRAVAELPVAQRTALLLHRFDGQSVRQIAGIMERSESAVESLLVRAYARLRVKLTDLDEKKSEK